MVRHDTERFPRVFVRAFVFLSGQFLDLGNNGGKHIRFINGTFSPCRIADRAV